jgi:tRNA(Ile)-lysidine synthase
MGIVSRIRRFIREHDLINPASRVAIAVSGGPDSMALLNLLQALARDRDLQLAGVVHFNHQLRPTAITHERFVAHAAASCGLPFLSGREDVAARRAREGCSIEQAARRARYEFFERARAELGADLVALGHTRDDQAETLLLRLVRGAGPRGLGGMYPRSGAIVRPLLDCRRGELLAWLKERPAEFSPPYLVDESNADVSIPRNRVRHELLPLLATRFNPSIVDVLAREAALLRDVWSWIEASGPPLDPGGTIDLALLSEAPPAQQRLIVWRALVRAAGGREISFDHVSSVVRLIQTDASDSEPHLDLPGVQVQRIGGRLVLTTRRSSRAAHGSGSANYFSYPLSIPGRVHIPEADCVVSAENPAAADEPGPGAAVGNGDAAAIRREAIRGSLVVRNRRPGDRFRPVGLCGSKKIQDLFVDRKVPRHRRDAVPIVVDESGQILWVAGHGIDERFRVTDPSQAVLVLRLTRAFHGGAPE